MSIRGPGAGGGANLAAATQAVMGGANPADVLRQMGLINIDWSLSPDDAVKQLLEFLVMQGFMPKADGAKKANSKMDSSSQLADALRQLQASQNLPQTGRLDERTVQTLEKFKAPSQTNTAPEPPRLPVNLADRAGARQATFFKDGDMGRRIQEKASDQLPPKPTLKPAPPSSQSATASAANPPPTAQTPQNAAPPPPPSAAAPNSAAQSPPSTSSALPKTAPPTTQQPPTTQTQSPATPAASSAPSSPNTTTAHPVQSAAQAETSKSATQGATASQTQTSGATVTEQAVAKQKQTDASPTTRVQESKDSSATGNAGQQQDAGGAAESAPDVYRGDAPIHVNYQDGHGNQATGDENDKDKRRGQAMVDDGSGVDEGVYEVPSLDEQIQKALKEFRKEEDTDPNKPTTYAADFILFKPGVYQSATMPPNILNLKVDNAPVYDEVWMQAIEEINKRIKRFDRTCWPLTFEDVHHAMQRARARSS